MTEQEFNEKLETLTTKAERIAFIEATDRVVKSFLDFAIANVNRIETELAPQRALLGSWKEEVTRLQDLRDLVSEEEWNVNTDISE